MVALACQLAAGILVFGAALAIDRGSGAIAPLAVKLFVQGGVAALLGLRFGLARWWVPIQILLPPAALAGMWLAVPPWAYLAAFLGLLLVYWNSAGERVPLYLTNPATWVAIEDLLADQGDASFIDLGSGLGGVLLHLARRWPRGRFAGVESAPVPFAVSWLRFRLAGLDNVRLAYGDLWKIDLASYDVVYCFLSPAPMAELYAKARAEMRPGALFVSNSFAVPGAPAGRVLEVDDRRRTRLHVWAM